MKIKILTFVNRNETGMMVDLHPNEVIAVDDEVGNDLIEEGKAEIVF